MKQCKIHGAVREWLLGMSIEEDMELRRGNYPSYIGDSTSTFLKAKKKKKKNEVK